MRSLVHLGWVFLGGGIGSALRYGMGASSARAGGSEFSAVAGSVVLSIAGFLAGMALVRGIVAT